jgi:hypothetical protein
MAHKDNMQVAQWNNETRQMDYRDMTPEEIAALPQQAIPAPPTLAEYTAAMQAVLDTTARARNYDGILSACTYATSTVDKFRAEGQACVEWRDKVWAFGYDLLAQVDAGETPPPALADLATILPQMVWPA